MATIRIPTPLRPFTASKEEVTVGGAKVSEVVANLAAAYPGFKRPYHRTRWRHPSLCEPLRQ